MENKPSRSTFRARFDMMLTQLREEILTGIYPSGTFLPSEDDLGEKFQLSKNSVRKVLDILVEENLITKKPRIGNEVNELKDHEEKVTVHFCYYPNSDKETNIFELIERFERKYPHIQVEPVVKHFQEYGELDNHMFDVIMLNYNNFRLYQKHGEIHRFKQQDVDQHTYQFLNDAFTVDEKLYAKPFVFSPVILCYNMDHFKEIGLAEPDSGWTWDTFRKAVDCLKITSIDQRRLGFYFHLLSLNRWPLFLLQNGFALREQDGKCVWDKEKFIESMDLVKQLFIDQQIIPSFVSENDYDTERLFREEKASMIVTTYFSLNNIQDVPFQYNISPIPYIDRPKTLLLNIGLAINSGTEHPAAAQLLVNFLTSKEAQQSIREDTFSIPSMKEIAESSVPSKEEEPKRFHMFREIIPSFSYYTDMNIESEHLESMLHHLKMYWSNIETEQSLLENIELEMKQMISK